MPGMSGPEFVRQLGSVMPSTPVLYVSGYTEDARETAFGDETVQLLEKPFTAETLVAKVREVLDRGEASDGDGR
jgi:two-component system cell cycle sensor histidine kinase/response regulator CckA